MTNGESDGFLQAEAEVDELLDQLLALKSEMESYAEARAALAEAGDDVFDAAEALKKLATAVGVMTRTAQEAGIPGLVATQERLAAEIQTLGKELLGKVGEGTSAGEQRGKQLALRIAGITGEMEKKLQGVESEIGSLAKDLKTTKTMVTNRLEELEGQVSRLRPLIVSQIGVLVIGLGILALLVLAR